MKSTIYRVLSLSALTVFAFSTAAFGQQTTTPEVAKAREVINKILDDSGRSFRDGLQRSSRTNARSWRKIR
jgi:hypothetical protein